MKSKQEIIDWLDKEIAFSNGCKNLSNLAYCDGEESAFKEIKGLMEEKEDNA